LDTCSSFFSIFNHDDHASQPLVFAKVVKEPTGKMKDVFGFAGSITEQENIWVGRKHLLELFICM
jgi:hypothetical protein